MVANLHEVLTPCGQRGFLEVGYLRDEIRFMAFSRAILHMCEESVYMIGGPCCEAGEQVVEVIWIKFSSVQFTIVENVT